MALTIAQIITVCWHVVLEEVKHGHPWADHRLNLLQRNGTIQLVERIGAIVEVLMDPGPNKQYPLEQTTALVTWTAEDERKNPREHERINLVKQLLENAINSHDDILLEKIGNGRAIISRPFRYMKSEIEEIPFQDAYCFRVSTVGAFIKD